MKKPKLEDLRRIRMMKPWIGVDLDGTLATYDKWRGIEHVGEPIKPMCDRVRAWLAEGKTVKIFTARVYNPDNRDITAVIAPVDAFCVQEFGQILPITNLKDYGMITLWDDRVIQVIPNTGERVGVGNLI